MSKKAVMTGLATAVHHPLIPFLKEPWASKSRYPAILLQTWLYGVYVVVFAGCLYTLRGVVIRKRAVIACVGVLFMLASADMVLTVFYFFRTALQTIFIPPIGRETATPEPWDKTLEYKFELYVVASAIASGLLTQRCYQVWGNKRMIVAPVCLIMTGTVISFISVAKSSLGDRLIAASFITSAAANFTLTVMIATRMWWVSRKAKSLLDVNPGYVHAIKFIGLLIIDSGALFSLALFFYLVFHTLVIDAALTQIAGITATSMVMRTSWTVKTGLLRHPTSMSTSVMGQRPVSHHLPEDTQSIASGSNGSDSASVNSAQFK